MGERLLHFQLNRHTIVDSISAKLRERGLVRPRKLQLPRAGKGVSVLIPERWNQDLLRECLLSTRQAGQLVGEPLETIVLASDSRPEGYARLVREFSHVRWHFVGQPLAFVQAIRRVLKLARYDWVYLLNNDMTLDSEALAEVLRWRAEDVFAVASQILFKDPSRRREETNWTDFRLVDGRIEIFDVEPEDNHTVRGNFYAGGGSSLFRRELLERVLPGSAVYEPFYWEDVEWSARARRSGFEVLFCPASCVRHTHRATVAKFHDASEVERVWQRNAMLFQLRNLPVSAPLATVFAHIRTLEESSLREILQLGRIARLLSARAAQFFYPESESRLYGCRRSVFQSVEFKGS